MMHVAGELKALVRGTYDIQKLRIQIGNRIVGNFKIKLGQQPGLNETDALDKEATELLDEMRNSYKKLTDGVVKLPTQRTFKSDGVITSYIELLLVGQYLELEEHEVKYFKRFKDVLRGFRVWTEFLKTIKGIGPAMSGVIISEIDISKAHYPSSLWKYAGLDVAEDGRGRSRRAEHLIDVNYTAKDGTKKSRRSITFNPFLKTKLMGVLGPSFLRCQGDYSKIYYDYKHRLEAREDWKLKMPGHRHNAAMHYMIKMFLCDLYNHWRAIEGLPVAPTYQEAKLLHKHNAG